MKNLKLVVVLLLFSFVAILNSCKKEDNIKPEMYLLGSNNQILNQAQNDTTVLLYTKYVDPGVKVEDNLSAVENIVVTNDSENVLKYTADGYLNRVENVVLTYTAVDEALNEAKISRTINIKNISEPFATTYLTSRTTLFIPNGTSYNSIVTVDNRIPGRINFPKVYRHDDSAADIYFKIGADLYNPTYSQQFSTEIAYMGKTGDKETPFFMDMSYAEGIAAITDFDYLMISAQVFTDALGHQYTIAGVSDPSNVNLPYSRIEYLDGTKTIKRIILELNVTKEGEYVDRVTEIYTPL